MKATDTLFGHNVGLVNVKCHSGVKLIILTKVLEHLGHCTG
jgi:hypothetical protein